MKIIPITRNELALSTEDWDRLKTLAIGFDDVCESQSCDSCPLEKFCHDHEDPAGYLKCLYDFLNDYPKEGE